MGKKIESITKMYDLGLPAPRCVFVMESDNINQKLSEYFLLHQNKKGFYTVRTDTENSSMSCKRILSATQQETIELATQWQNEGFQIILQELIDEREEIKSGNIFLKENEIVIEGALDKHIIFTNGKYPDINATVNRFEGYNFSLHKLFIKQQCFSYSEIIRLIRLARKIPYTNAVVEFSFFLNGSLYFWEIKKISKKVAIDIDGTLTNEIAYCLGYNYEDVSKTILNCTLKSGVKEVNNSNLDITLITGRIEMYRKETEQWLRNNGIKYDRLIMIPNNYYKNGFDMKLFLDFKLQNCVNNRINFALDDNEEVIKILRSHSIKAQLVKENFKEAFNKLFKGE